MVSVLIAARNEKYLEQTIRDVLKNAEGEIEIIVILDGYIPSPQIITNNDRVHFIHHKESIGQRKSINEAARLAKGKYIMKLDAHCAVDKGFDVKLAANCEYDWTVVPRMYNLDIETWKPKLHKRTDYMYIGCGEGRLLRAEYFNKGQPDNTKMIDDTMCCMGPGWFMHKDRFWELGGCDENHGSWGQQGVEVSLKAWLSGGSLKVNKNTWFAHWFRGNIGFPYPISGRDIESARTYSRDLWIHDKWPLAKRKFDWLIKKFNPPGWNNMEKRMEVNSYLYKHIHREKHPVIWKGIKILKMPSDLLLYHRVIWETQPDYIVEIGTKYGGSAVFFQDMLDVTGKGKVITIDIKDIVENKDPRITYLVGDSISQEIIKKVKELTSGKVMVVIDGNHHRKHVKWELHHYSSMVSSGQYLVVEDCYTDRGLYGPGEARDWFMKSNKDFIQTNLDQEFLVGICIGSWLQRK